MKELAIVIPCYNEEKNILPLYASLEPVLQSLLMSYAIYFVDDGSKDNTLNIIKQLANEHPEVEYISLSRNFGHQKALKAGIDHADGQAIIMMDADMQHPASLIPTLVSKWKEGFQIVNTIRRYNHSWTFFKRITSRLFYPCINLISGIQITPYSPDFRLIDRQVAQTLRTCHEEYLFLRGMVHWCGFKQTCISFQDGDRYTGHSQYTWHKMFSLAVSGITAFSVRPLKISLILSLFFAACSIGMFLFHYTQPTISPAWFPLGAWMAFQTSCILFVLGVVGEYIGRYFIIADLYLYLPYAAFSICLVWFATAYWQTKYKYLLISSIIYLGYLGGYTLWYMPFWKDSPTLKHHFREILKQRGIESKESQSDKKERKI